jgi:diguanylate cyclase (GGDEF)-like protein/PAS domain S-box-containing protein
MSGTKSACADHPKAESSIKGLRRLVSICERLLLTVEEQARREQDWQRERDLFRAMIDQVPDYLFVKDRDSRFVVANKAVAADLGLKPEALIGKTDFDLHPPTLATKFFDDEQKVIATEQPMLDIAEFVVQPSGREKWLSTSKVPMFNEAGEVIGIVGISRDVTDKKRAEAQIEHMAYHDALTGLPNRVLLMDRIGKAIAAAQKNGTSVVVVFVDLDRFKVVNDTLGHSMGDALLKALAARMIQSVRASDTVARLSGDEFVVVLEGVTEDADRGLLPVIKHLRTAFRDPVIVSGRSLRASCSIGIASYPRDGTDPAALLMYADRAMYEAKRRGRDTYAFYTTPTDAVVQAGSAV